MISILLLNLIKITKNLSFFNFQAFSLLSTKAQKPKNLGTFQSVATSLMKGCLMVTCTIFKCVLRTNLRGLIHKCICKSHGIQMSMLPPNQQTGHSLEMSHGCPLNNLPSGSEKFFNSTVTVYLEAMTVDNTGNQNIIIYKNIRILQVACINYYFNPFHGSVTKHLQGMIIFPCKRSLLTNRPA